MRHLLFDEGFDFIAADKANAMMRIDLNLFTGYRMNALIRRNNLFFESTEIDDIDFSVGY